jgi:hypothetical protein
MASFANFFLRCTPQSILVNDASAWLVVRDRPRPGFESGKEWFLPSPTDPAVVSDALTRFQIRSNRRLSLFLREFAGLRECMPDISGYFPRVQDWLPFEKYVVEMGWGVSRIPRVWSGAVVFFESLCGDALLLDRAGRLGWWCHELDNHYKVLFRTFDRFPAHYLTYARQPYPF